MHNLHQFADTPISSIIILLYILYISYGYIARTGKVPPTICRLLVWMVTATGWWQACLSAIPKWKSREAGCQPAVVEVWWPANGTLRYFHVFSHCKDLWDGIRSSFHCHLLGQVGSDQINSDHRSVTPQVVAAARHRDVGGCPRILDGRELSPRCLW